MVQWVQVLPRFPPEMLSRVAVKLSPVIPVWPGLATMVLSLITRLPEPT